MDVVNRLTDILGEEVLNLTVTVIPILVGFAVFSKLIRYLVDCSGVVSSSFVIPDIPKEKEPEKPKETVVKTYVINSPVKMEPVSKTRDIPKRCPNCWGIPDNSDYCQYCGSKF